MARTAILLVGALAVASMGVVAVRAQGPTTNDGIYTAAQAAKGKEPLDLDTLDLSDFAVAVFERKGANLRPSQKDAAVTGFLAETTELHKLGVTYETEFLARGHQALYELLASMYSLALRIESSAHAGLVVEAIRKDLKEAHGLTIQSNSTPMAADDHTRPLVPMPASVSPRCNGCVVCFASAR